MPPLNSSFHSFDGTPITPPPHSFLSFSDQIHLQEYHHYDPHTILGVWEIIPPAGENGASSTSSQTKSYQGSVWAPGSKTVRLFWETPLLEKFGITPPPTPNDLPSSKWMLELTPTHPTGLFEGSISLTPCFCTEVEGSLPSTVSAFNDTANQVVISDGAPADGKKSLQEKPLPNQAASLKWHRGEKLPASCYSIEVEQADGSFYRYRDPYAFRPQVSDLDLFLFGEGRHWDLAQWMGAHPKVCEGIAGTLFTVWAPNAQRVSLVGDWNRWDGRYHLMRQLGRSGVWELFIPGVKEGMHYKFELLNQTGALQLKTDPYAFFAQHGEETACMVYDLGHYQWEDQAWMEQRSQKNLNQEPLSIYEVHLPSWRRVPEEGNRSLSYQELGDQLIPYVQEMGFTHIELMPIMEHPFDGSWGYQITNYFAPTSRLGSPDEFRALVDRFHQAGIGVLLDWVPGHFPRDAHGLARFDGTPLYEHADPRRGEHRDWGTLIFNYGRHEVRNFLIANALFWLKEYHLDGLRVDAVASMLYLDYSRSAGDWEPNCFGGRENLEAIEFLKCCNETCYNRHPGIMMIAEESTSWPQVSHPTYSGGLGFGFKWNMGWMNDSLRYIEHEPIHRKYHQGEITFAMIYAYHEHFILVLSHDEVVHGKKSLLSKMPGDFWQQFANLRLFLSWMWSHPGKKLLFQGGEWGQWAEWNYQKSLDWHLLDHAPHQGLQHLVRELNQIYCHQPALYALEENRAGFEWVDFADHAQSVWSFLRKAPPQSDAADLLIIVHATPEIRPHYRIGVPRLGSYNIIFNSDAPCFWGSGLPLPPSLQAEAIPAHGFPCSIELTLPPLATLYFQLPL